MWEDIEDSVIEATGSIISKTIEEAQNELENQIEENIVENQENTTALTGEEQTEPTVAKEKVKKELAFAYPVEGEILRDFSMDELIYSET